MTQIAIGGAATGTGTFTISAPVSNISRTQTLPDVSGQFSILDLRSELTASGTSVTFIDIPSTVRRVTVMFAGLSTNGTSGFLIQLGAGGVIEATGYNAIIYDGVTGSAQNVINSATGWQINVPPSAAASLHGQLILTRMSNLTWVGNGSASETGRFESFAGSKTLAGVLDRVRLTTVNGTDTFDAGTISILVE